MKDRTQKLPIISTPVTLKVITRKVSVRGVFIDECEVMLVTQIFLW